MRALHLLLNTLTSARMGILPTIKFFLGFLFFALISLLIFGNFWMLPIIMFLGMLICIFAPVMGPPNERVWRARQKLARLNQRR